jgi:hypothetical protein
MPDPRLLTEECGNRGGENNENLGRDLFRLSGRWCGLHSRRLSNGYGRSRWWRGRLAIVLPQRFP